MSFYARLRAATEDGRRDLFAVPQIREALDGRISLPTYLAYLGQAYHHVRHTTPLLKLARDRLDGAHERFRRALGDYVDEETGHEAWILNDIAAAGGDAEAARDSRPGPAAGALVAYAYDYVGRINPMGLFGMIFVLEDTSAAIASQGAARVAQALGLGPECFTYLASHGELDKEHMRFFEGLVDEIDDEADQRAVVEVARQVYRLFADLFRGIPHRQEEEAAHAH